MNKVMACVDAQGNPAAVCDGAIWAARSMGAPLTFLHVLDRHPEKAQRSDFSGQIGLGAQESLLNELAELDARRSTLAQEQGRQVLAGTQQRAQAAGMTDVQVRQRHGELVEAVAELEAETSLVVMGQHEHQAWAGRHLDHHVERVIRTIHKPVLVIPGKTFDPPRGFALAYDGSEAAQRLVSQVGHSEWLRGLACDLVHVGATDPALHEAQESAAEQLRSHGFHVKTALIAGHVERAVPQYMTEQGLGMLVMGAYGHSRIRHLVVGSTTTALLRTTGVPMLVLR